MKTYRLTCPDDYKGLFKVSLVDDPAIASNLMYFSDEDKTMMFADDEKRIIYAPALIPNKLIFRKNINGEQANVYFDAETISDLQVNYFRKNGNKETNLNHQPTNVDGVFSFENWIVEDSVQDKAFKLGFDVPVGTMMMAHKIDNDQVWADIKGGKLNGLSIEAQLFPEEKLNFKSEIIMNKKGAFALAIEKLKEIFESEDDKKEEVLPVEEVKEEELADELPTEEEVVVEEEPADDEKDAKILELETKIAELEAQLTEANATKMANEEAEVKLKSDFDALTVENTKLQSDLIELKKIPSIPNGEDEKETPLSMYRKKKEMLK